LGCSLNAIFLETGPFRALPLIPRVLPYLLLHAQVSEIEILHLLLFSGVKLQQDRTSSDHIFSKISHFGHILPFIVKNGLPPSLHSILLSRSKGGVGISIAEGRLSPEHSKERSFQVQSSLPPEFVNLFEYVWIQIWDKFLGSEFAAFL